MRLIDVGVLLTGLIRPIDSLPNPWPWAYWGPVYDPLELLLFEMSHFRLDGVPAATYYGLSGTNPSSDQVQRFGLKPVHVPYESRRDFNNYANNLFWIMNTASTIPQQENGVLHITAPKGVYSATRELYHREVKIPHHGADISRFDQTTIWGAAYTFQTSSGSDFGITQNVNYAGVTYSNGSIEQHLEDIRGVLASPPSGYTLQDFILGLNLWGTSFRGSEAGIYYERRSQSFTLRYTTYARSAGYYLIKIRRQVHVRMELVGGRTPVGFSTSGDRLRVIVRAAYDDTCSYYEGYTSAGLAWTPVSGYQNVRSSTVIEVDGPQCIALCKAYHDDDRVGEDVVAFLQKERAWVRSLGSDLRPASAISSADAAAKLTSDSNYVEAFLEAGQMLDLLEGPLKAGGGLMKIFARRGLSLRDLGEFVLDVSAIATDLQLLYSFGIKPTAQDAHELAYVGQRLRILALVLKRGWVTRGDHAFTEEVDGITVDFKIRSKLVFQPFSAEGLQQLIRLDQSGYLPTPSRIWNSLKYTFLLDYALSFGERMRVIEMYVIQSLLGLKYGVHSFRVNYRSKDTDFVDNGGQPVLISGYTREATAYVSDPARNSNLNYFPPRRPSIGVFFALIVKAILKLLFNR